MIHPKQQLQDLEVKIIIFQKKKEKFTEINSST